MDLKVNQVELPFLPHIQLFFRVFQDKKTNLLITPT